MFPAVKLGLKLWHRRWEIQGSENTPEGPVLLIANHQNGMEDPVVCCIAASRQCHFLTRADIFAKPSTDRFLRSMNMIPVYRPRDRKSDAKDLNLKSFAQARERLEQGCIVSLFPEGNHANKHALRSFKTGMARIAFDCLDDWVDDPNRPNDIAILPVGLHYENYARFRSDLLVNMGEPIYLGDLLPLYRKDPQEAVQQATNRARLALQNEMIDLPSGEQYNTLNALKDIANYGQPYPRYGRLSSQFRHSQWTVERLMEGPEDHFQKTESAYKAYQEASASLGMEVHAVPKRHTTVGYRLRSAFVAALGLPLAIMGAVLNFGPALLTHYMVTKKIKDPHFKSSFGSAVPGLTLPIWWALLFVLTSLTVSPWCAPVVVIAAIASAILALHYRDRITDVRRALRLQALKRKNVQAFTKAQGCLEQLHAHLG